MPTSFDDTTALSGVDYFYRVKAFNAGGDSAPSATVSAGVVGCGLVGLGIANVFACALFAAMAGSSPATCSAIGSAGIPEMRKRGYSPGFAAGIIAAGFGGGTALFIPFIASRRQSPT